MNTECQNCGAELSGGYCGTCGQKGDAGIPSVGRLLGVVLGGSYASAFMWTLLVTIVAAAFTL